MSEKTFIEALCDCRDCLHDSKDELAHIARCLHEVGMTKLADRLAAIAKDIDGAIVNLHQGQTMALDRVVNSAHQGTINMVNAALAAASRDT